MAKYFPESWVVPGLNTTFLGLPEEQGIWTEQCQACGNCVLATTGGICPISRCSKQLQNGPCGGSEHGLCEVKRVKREQGIPVMVDGPRGRKVPATEDVDCAWHQIHDRLKQADRLEQIKHQKLLGLEKARYRRASGHGGRRGRT